MNRGALLLTKVAPFLVEDELKWLGGLYAQALLKLMSSLRDYVLSNQYLKMY